MTTLITGSTGFVLSNVVRQVALQGETVVAADLVPPDALLDSHWSDVRERIEFRRLDVTDGAAIQTLLRETRPDRLIHGAAVTSVPRETERTRFIRTVEVNVLGTLRLLDALRETGIGRVVVISSGSLYGKRDVLQPVTEEDPASPLGVYPMSKWAAESFARRFAEIEGMDLAVIRLSAPYGPMERDTGSRPLLSVVQQWTTAALRGEPVVVYGSGDQVRDLTYVDDIATGVFAVLSASRLPHRIYNLGIGRNYTFDETLIALRTLVPDVRIEHQPIEPGAGLPPTRGPLSHSRLSRDFDWRSRYSLETGLAAYITWLRETGVGG